MPRRGDEFDPRSDARQVLGGILGFVVFLLGIGHFSHITGIDTHDAPSVLGFLGGVAAVALTGAIGAFLASRIAGRAKARAVRLLALCLLASSTITLLRTHEWASGWLAWIVLSGGAVLLLAGRAAGNGNGPIRGRP